MKKILLTGSEGFIGQHVRLKLEELGIEVFGVDALEARVHSSPSWPFINCDRGSHFKACYTADTPYEFLMQVDAVIHLAAQVGVVDSMKEPVRYVRDNTRDTVFFLDEIRRHKNIKRLIVASSMSIYGQDGVRVRETAPPDPQSIYALTKYDQEQLCLLLGKQAGIAVTALRFFNTYGPGQALHNPYTGVLANFANWVLNDEQPIIYEDGQQTRDFIYVEDVADAVVNTALTPELPSDVYNICTGNATTIETVARAMIMALGKPELTPNITFEKRPGDIRHCTGDPTRTAREMKWRYRVSFQDGIEKYGQHLQENQIVTIDV